MANATRASTTSSKPGRTDQQIVDQTNKLAAVFYRAMGYVVSAGYRFDWATHPQEQLVWEMACQAQVEMTDTDPNDAVDNLEVV